MRFNFIIFLLLIFISAGFSQKLSSRHWNVSLGIAPSYDDNILRNSDKYIQRFINKEDEGRFHIKSYDDLVVDYDAAVSYENSFFKKLRTAISALVNYNSFSYNPVKSWVSYQAVLQQNLTPALSLNLSYSYLPDFYVKHYRDFDWLHLLGAVPESFKPFSFSKHETGIWIQQVFNPSTRARAYFSYMKYYYNSHFTEYDSRNLMFGIRGFRKIGKSISADIWYRYITSDAKGYDEPGETKLTSDEGDGSYNEHLINLGCDIEIPRILKFNNTVALDLEFGYRTYMSKKNGEEDKIHAGRKDDYYNIGLTYKLEITRSAAVSAFYKWALRDADTSIDANRTYLSDEKDYQQNIAGLSFNYKFTF